MWKAVIVYPNGIRCSYDTTDSGKKITWAKINRNRASGHIKGMILGVFTNFKHQQVHKSLERWSTVS